MSAANLWVILTLLFTAKTPAKAADINSINESLQKWQRNPRGFMEEPVQKWSTVSGLESSGNKGSLKNEPLNMLKLPETHRGLTSSRDLSLKMAQYHHEIRHRIMMGNRPNAKAAPDLTNDNPNLFTSDGVKYSNIFELNKPGLRRAEAKIRPWSGDYWATNKGGIGARYADESFPFSGDWKINFEYVIKNPFKDLLRPGALQNPDHLSPAEKYDLLTQSDGHLTQFAWNEGKEYYDRFGEVEGWFGICHGWAAASYIEKRPQSAIEVPIKISASTSGEDAVDTKITLNPADIKALISQMWANGIYQNRFMGGRCDIKEPKVDEVSGRLLEKDCFDINPMSWHLAMTHEIGVYKTPFVMDASEDYEVWNQPAYKYEISYFNPMTASQSTDLESAIIDYRDWKKDPYKKWRKSGLQKLVGIVMDVTYGVETLANSSLTDTPSEDQSNTVRYIYDLELDRNGKIIGGEWYQRQHPDFLWTPEKNTFPISYGDFEIEDLSWDPKSDIIPASWKDNVITAAKNGGIPRLILKNIVEQSAAEETPNDE